MKQATADRSAKARRSARSDENVDFRKLKTIPILKRGEKPITIDEALRRARKNPVTNHGEQFARKLAADLNAGRVSCKNWRVEWCVIFGRGSQRIDGRSCAWHVFRSPGGFYCDCHDFSGSVSSRGRLLRLDK